MGFIKRKTAAVISIVLFAAALISGCGGNGNPQGQAGTSHQDSDSGPLQIVTTVFPAYDWTRNILGEEGEGAPAAELTLLTDNGVDMHSYQPSVEDILKISSCDVFIYVGGESDRWVEDALREAVNKDMIRINLLELMGDSAREEELAEGMQEEEEETDSHKEGGPEPEGPEYDEHVWLSLRNAEKLCGVIADALSQADPDNAGNYEQNLSAYMEQLKQLEQAYAEAAAQSGGRPLLVADRFPFLYLAKDYSLPYYAAFAGCSAETEASFETITFLAEKVDEYNLPYVLTIEGSDGRLAEAVIRSTKAGDQKVLTLNSLQSVTAQQLAEGCSYLDVMEDNLQTLREYWK